MSNLQNTTRSSLRTTRTNKWKSHTTTNDLLERKTQALEGSLNKLTLNIQQDQTKSTIDTHGRNRNKEMSQYKPTVNLFSTKLKQVAKCGQCEKVDAKMKCLECGEKYCSSCFAQFHLRGALQRHHCIPLLTFQQKTLELITDTNLKKSPDKPVNDNVHQKSNIHEKTEVSNEKSNFLTFQQSFLQWRDNNITKLQRIKQRHGLMSPISDGIEYANKLPHIEFNSSKKDQHTNKSNQENFIQRSKKINLTKIDQAKPGVLINICDPFSDNLNFNEPTIDIGPLNDDLSTEQTAESIEIINSEMILNNDNNLERERPITHVSIKSFSRPTSSSIKKDLISPRPNSIVLVQQSLHSLLTTKSNDELEAIVDSRLILSRPSSPTLEKFDQPLNSQILQSTSNSIDVQSAVIDKSTIGQFDLALSDLTDGSKFESAYQLNFSSENIPQVISGKDQPSIHAFCMNSEMAIPPHRHSPFSFTNSLYKTSRIDSASSRDTGDGGFFTDILPRRTIPSPIPLPPLPLPPPILECSTSNEWKHTLEDQPIEQDQVISNPISLRKSSSKSLSRVSSKDSITHKEIRHRSKSQIDNNSRPDSSLSSASLPVSMTSSKPGFNNSEDQSPATLSRKTSSSNIKKFASSPSALKNSSSSTMKKTSSSTSKTTSTARSEKASSSATETSPTATTEKTSSSTTKTSPTVTTEKTSSSTTKTSPTATTEKTSSSESIVKPTIKSSSPQPEPIVPIITEDKKETLPSDPDECLQESMNSLKDKSSSNVDASESVYDLLQSNLTTFLTREGNITENDLPSKKRIRRQTTNSDELSKYRKLEFSVGDGLKWQEASTESMSSTEPIPSKQSSNVTTPQSLTPSNPINTELAKQFSKYDNDDGRSSRTYQNINDEQYFNELRQEICSETDKKESNGDAILNDHILKILQGVQIPYNEKDLIMIGTKLQENETVHQP